jgi:hypothetical protein
VQGIVTDEMPVCARCEREFESPSEYFRHSSGDLLCRDQVACRYRAAEDKWEHAAELLGYRR